MTEVRMWEGVDIQGPFVLWKASKDLLKYSPLTKGYSIASQTWELLNPQKCAEIGFSALKYFCVLAVHFFESFTQGHLGLGFQREQDITIDVDTKAHCEDTCRDFV